MFGGLALKATPAHAVLADFRSWASSYMRQGRVIDWQQNAISHSEGQGWGLLLAQAAGDRKAF
jgi:endoglucanase